MNEELSSNWRCNEISLIHETELYLAKECVAVLTMLYKKNSAISCVGSGFLSDWALYVARIYKRHAPWSVGG